MIVLDTNVVSALMRPKIDPHLARWLSGRAQDVFAITSVTMMEICYGLRRLPDGRRRRDLERRFAELTNVSDGLPVLDFDRRVAIVAAAFQAEREALGRPSTQADMMIAAVCHLHAAWLATRNLRDFEHLGLEVVDPFVADASRQPEPAP